MVAKNGSIYSQGSIKKYNCQFCDYSSLNSGHVRRHILTHTGERPFKCNICGRGFTQKNNLKKHMLVHFT
ncbi:unnamed protein product [Larinioides sclopetarius]|uniref:C2H2-type domain-containing protein n=1 Tax=Larinioides sclopetarius TaxID=280406 RepID=A0AAV2A6J2_9ARAC